MFRLILLAFVTLALAAGGLAGAQPAQDAPPGAQAEAVFAVGCFWCGESDFEHLAGITGVVSGYAGGTRANPTYQSHEGYIESIRVSYDPARVSYAQLLSNFWRHHDPLDAGGQFCDRGQQYRAAIFATPEQMPAAQASLAETERVLGQNVATRILPAGRFWRAEDYHQDYYLKNPIPYRFYRLRCGRDARVEQVWRGH